MNEQKSEVFQLLQKIEQEYQSTVSGLTELASGTMRHDFIRKKMANMQRVHERLVELMGPDEAIALVVHTIDLSANQQQGI